MIMLVVLSIKNLEVEERAAETDSRWQLVSGQVFDVHVRLDRRNGKKCAD